MRKDYILFQILQITLNSVLGFSDNFSQSVITSLEPRAFGSEAEYISHRLKRRDSEGQSQVSGVSVTDLDIQRHSVIVNPSQLHEGSRDNTPSPSLSLLPSLPVSSSSITQSTVSTLSSFDSYLESPSHPRLSEHPQQQQSSVSKLCLKEEPEVTKVEQLFLSSEFSVTAPPALTRPPPSVVSSPVVTTAPIPNFLHFTPDESVTQSLLQGQAQCNKQAPSPLSSSTESDILGLVQESQEPAAAT